MGYDHHIPTSMLQKLILAGGSALVGLADPWRADMVAASGEVTASPAALRALRDKMLACDEGRVVLETRPRITSSILTDLAALPPNMVGEVAVKWVEALQLGLPMCVGGAVLGPL